ncbi:MAG: hypothetical protein H8E36_15270 [Rhodospirillaceae bacterium]|nr:hypothetical protein [Rhodospirillaceae bacterium]MBL6929894.1 hypothetical protein [Rhodospirillales bacterium]MBL6941614.1 hypothetical protein [Rhodospirillales bacterium]
MVHDPEDHSRLLLEINEKIKKLNKEIIDPMIPKLKIDDLTPVIKLVAQIRAAYLKELFDISATVSDGVPTQDQIQRLRGFRVAYEEFSAAAQAMETAIEHGYLEVEEK